MKHTGLLLALFGALCSNAHTNEVAAFAAPTSSSTTRPQPRAQDATTIPRNWGVTRSSTALHSSVLGAVDAFYKTMPLASAFLTCGFKASMADMVAQRRASKQQQAAAWNDEAEADALVLGEIDETPFERRRNLAFLLYGGLYQGEHTHSTKCECRRGSSFNAQLVAAMH